MKVGILAPVWKRPEIFDVFLDGAFALTDIVIVAGSPNDECEEIAKARNCVYIQEENQPLATKLRAATLASKNLDIDYLLMLGSDDIFSEKLFDRYVELMESCIDYIYVLDYYFFHTATKQGLYWKGYNTDRNRNHACGAGRALSRNLLDQLDWNVWANGYDAILDTGMDVRLQTVGHSKKGLHIGTEGLFGLDIKGAMNMTPFALWDNSTYIDGKKMLYDNLPKKLADTIYKELSNG